MVMAGGMYPNMMMQGAMMGGSMMSSTGMEMMSGTGMDIMSQASIDMSSMGAQTIAAATPTMDMSMMGGMVMDPGMMGMYSNMGDIAGAQEKKEILFKYCKLLPPALGTPQPPRRARPPGCRTIFVGGLPEKIRESTVRDIFEPYGRIHTLRLSKKDFCHIRFDRENSVDAAMQLSGYRIKLINKDKEGEEEEDTKATSGWLHVDYALV
jgi:hypothetical protein